MIAAYAGAALIVLGFSMLFVRLGLTQRAGQVGAVARHSLATLNQADLDDDAKEAAMQADAKALFALFATLTLGLAAALGIPLALAWLLGAAHLWSFDAVIAASLSWPLILAGCAAFAASVLLGRRRVVQE